MPTLKAVVTNVVNARYRITTILAAVIILAATVACIFHFSDAWAKQLLEKIVLGAIAVILVNPNVTDTPTPK